jgi:hypothetical protein
MHADLDTLCTAVYCTADDLLPERPGDARRRVTDAEVATLCVAQATMGIPPIAASWRSPVGGSATSSRNCPSSPTTTSEGPASPGRSSGWSASSPPGAPASTTT